MTVKLTPLSNLTCWSLSLTLDPAVVPLSIKTTRNELKQISGTGVTAQEFQEVKRYLLGSLPVRTQSTLGSIGNSLLESAKHSDTINGYAAEIASIKASTLESVNKVIRGVFKPGESALVIAGGAQSIKAGRNNAGAADEAEKPAADNPSGSKTLSAEGQAAPAKPDSVPAKMEENSASDGKVKQKG